MSDNQGDVTEGRWIIQCVECEWSFPKDGLPESFVFTLMDFHHLLRHPERWSAANHRAAVSYYEDLLGPEAFESVRMMATGSSTNRLGTLRVRPVGAAAETGRASPFAPPL